MKIIVVLSVLALFHSQSVFSQSQYEISYDKSRNNVKVLNGLINKYLVMNDSTFTWYKSNQQSYSPDTYILNAFEKNKDSVHYILFGGTWCSDTQDILPKFFKLQEKAGVSDKMITFFGVNIDKKSLGNITESLNITNVPTIIIMKNGKEIGRVIEYGKTGKWDKEIADIISN